MLQGYIIVVYYYCGKRALTQWSMITKLFSKVLLHNYSAELDYIIIQQSLIT